MKIRGWIRHGGAGCLWRRAVVRASTTLWTVACGFAVGGGAMPQVATIVLLLSLSLNGLSRAYAGVVVGSLRVLSLGRRVYNKFNRVIRGKIIGFLAETCEAYLGRLYC